MADTRGPLLAIIRSRLSEARQVAAAELARQEQAAALARRRHSQIRRSAATTVKSSSAQLAEGLAAAAARHSGTLTTLARRVQLAADQAAPGCASAPWSGWVPTPLGQNLPAPSLRVGHLLVDGIEVPALIPLLDHGHIALTGDDPAAADSLLTSVLARTLGGADPGKLRLLGYDPEYLGGRLAPFAPLTAAGLLTLAGPRGLTSLLDQLVDHVHRISHSVLAGEYATLRQRAQRGGGRPEPWRLAVLLGDGSELTPHEQAQIRRLVRAGAACGVHLLTCGVPLPPAETVTTVALRGCRASIARYRSFDVILDEPPPPMLVTDLARMIAEKVIVGPPPLLVDQLLPDPDKFWMERSPGDLRAPIGEDSAGQLVELVLSDHPPHALIGGPTGSGKTNLIYAWLAALTTRYSPDELELYLLDFKEGVSFARFAPTPRDRSWLPHARLVGLNANTDREFGIALLRFLGEELRRRAEAARRFSVTKLSELRAEDPAQRWPRIVAVIDEFQVLFGGRDALTNQATHLLEDLARRGRSQGIHLVLASQDVSGIEALWGRSALLAQFSLRIALPKARRVLVETNSAANEIPRHHAVVNSDSGVTSANRVVRIPDAGDRTMWNGLLSQLSELWRSTHGDCPEPRVFDGDAIPRLVDAPDFAKLAPCGADLVPVALLGQAVDVDARSVALPLSRSPGRNLAVLGTASAPARAVLSAAGRSLARQYHAGAARFSVAILDSDRSAALPEDRSGLPGETLWYTRDTVLDLLDGVAGDLLASEKIADKTAGWEAEICPASDRPSQPHFLLLYGVDGAARQLAAKRPGGSGLDRLRTILQVGPERHTHVLGWWRTVSRLRDDLGGLAARFDVFGAWVALDVHGSELAPLSPAGVPGWYPRPWRAMFFDRARHRVGEVMVPYQEDQ